MFGRRIIRPVPLCLAACVATAAPARVEAQVAEAPAPQQAGGPGRLVEAADPFRPNFVIRLSPDVGPGRHVGLIAPPLAPPPAGDLAGRIEAVVADAVKKVYSPPPAFGPAVVLRRNPNVGIGRNEGNFGALQQKTAEFRPILRGEYGFARLVCSPTKEQRLPIARAGLKALEQAAQAHVDWEKNRNQVVGGRLVERPAIIDVRGFIQKALVAAVRANVAADQAEAYRVELAARAANQKRAAVLGFVARLDQALILSREQRARIEAVVSTRWDEPWAQGLRESALSGEAYPMVPDEVLSDILNDEQTAIWNSLPRITFSSTGLIFGVITNQAPLDEAFSDEEALRDALEPTVEAASASATQPRSGTEATP